MILIADSGSTKTTWSLLESRDATSCETPGINPFYQDEASIIKNIKKKFSLNKQPDSIYFYGAGCTDRQKKKIVINALKNFFTTEEIFVESDLMGAARSLCQNNEGIACILGTGSNSCHYDGKKIIANVPALGFILGDEGSGSVLGKRLVSDILKSQLPAHISKLFFETYSYSQKQILENVYKKPFPNRFTAQLTKFIAANIHEEYFQNLVKTGFNEFLARNVSQYPRSANLPIHFTGSVAFYFEKILKETAIATGLQVGKITQSPMEGLITYHQKNNN